MDKSIEERVIENEINRRVAFKMAEIRSQFTQGLEVAKLVDTASWGHLYTRGFLKSYQIVNDVLEKEILMGTPYDGDFEHKIWLRKEKLVNDLSSRLLKKGTRDYDRLKSFINDKIENFIDV